MLRKAELLDLAQRLSEANYLQLVKLTATGEQRKWSRKLNMKDREQLAKILTLWAEQMTEERPGE